MASFLPKPMASDKPQLQLEVKKYLCFLLTITTDQQLFDIQLQQGVRKYV